MNPKVAQLGDEIKIIKPGCQYYHCQGMILTVTQQYVAPFYPREEDKLRVRCKLPEEIVKACIMRPWLKEGTCYFEPDEYEIVGGEGDEGFDVVI